MEVEQLRSHLRGRRHQHSLDLAAVAERSVYVRGFLPKEVEERALRETFEQFGGIKQVFFGGTQQNKKLYAIVEFLEKGSALKALQHTETLYLHGRKLVVKPREWKTPHRGKRKGEESDAVQEAAPPGNSPIPKSIGGIRLQQETIAELQEAQSLLKQVEVLAKHCHIPASTVEAQFSLCNKLNLFFRETFPHCILVPFGAPISGHGTVTSDCDISLLTDPSEEDRRCFSGEGYYSEEHLAMWERVTRNESTPGKEDTSEINSQSDCGEQDLDVSSDSTISSSTSPTMPPSPHSKKAPHSCSPEFDVVLAIIHTIPACNKVLPIPFARCPIVRFYYERSQLHCDLSVNNRLSPCNTQLMRAYYDFNPSLSLLVPVVRMWARFVGLTRMSLNNYAVSLLLIYALQHTTPPVLPCLQNTGAWPRNMEWFATKGFAATTGVSQGRISPGGWKCEFTSPGSLMPSKNTASVAELLLHFFQFYSEEFDFSLDVVAVHHPAPARLSKQEAASLACREHTDESTPPRKQASLKITPICLQDPFELCHNVTKSLSKVAFFQDMLTASRVILQEQLQLEKSVADPSVTGGNLFALFDQAQYQWVASRLPAKDQRRSKFLMLTATHIAGLLQKVSALKLLGERLGDLDLSNECLVGKLADVVMQALVAIMEDQLKFTCEAETVYPSSADCSAMEIGVESTLPQAVGGEAPQDIGRGGDMEVEKMVEGPSTAEEDGGTRKRQRTEQHSEGTHSEEPKRAKLFPVPVALQLLCSAVRGTEAYLCTAHTNTWLHRRKAQREQQHQGGASITALPPPETPDLQFSLSSLTSASNELKGVSVPSETIAIVKLMPTELQQRTDFSTFFAFFKKLIIS